MRARWRGTALAFAVLVFLVMMGLAFALYAAWWAFWNLTPRGA
jgi:hypothetical protein